MPRTIQAWTPSFFHPTDTCCWVNISINRPNLETVLVGARELQADLEQADWLIITVREAHYDEHRRAGSYLWPPCFADGDEEDVFINCPLPVGRRADPEALAQWFQTAVSNPQPPPIPDPYDED